MNRLNRFFIIPIMLLGILCCQCNKKQQSFYAVSILFDYKDGATLFFIGTSENYINSALATDSSLQQRFSPIWCEAIYDYHGSDLKCILTPPAFNYLLNYILNNCHTEDLDKPIPISTFTIHAYSPEKDQICKYYYNDQLATYFRNMIVYLTKSPYADDYEGLINKIREYINDYRRYKRK